MTPPASPALLEFTLAVDGEAAEAVCELFERHGGGAVVEVTPAVVSEAAGDLSVVRTRVRTYIPADDVDARARLEVGLWHLAQLYPMPEATVRALAEANWAEAWKADYTPQHIGPFLVVPSWLEAPATGGLVIRLDPGMAFGTGLHPTTRLCLMALAELVTPGATVLDVGTGSGILAIGAARLGAGRVVGLDVDPRAVTTAAENAKANGVALATHHGALSTLPAESFDGLAANLLAGLLQDLAAALAARAVPGGWLVASGVLAEQTAAVSAALQAAGFAPPQVRRSGDWVALITHRRAAG